MVIWVSPAIGVLPVARVVSGRARPRPSRLLLVRPHDFRAQDRLVQVELGGRVPSWCPALPSSILRRSRARSGWSNRTSGHAEGGPHPAPDKPRGRMRKLAPSLAPEESEVGASSRLVDDRRGSSPPADHRFQVVSRPQLPCKTLRLSQRNRVISRSFAIPGFPSSTNPQALAQQPLDSPERWHDVALDGNISAGLPRPSHGPRRTAAARTVVGDDSTGTRCRPAQDCFHDHDSPIIRMAQLSKSVNAPTVGLAHFLVTTLEQQ